MRARRKLVSAAGGVALLATLAVGPTAAADPIGDATGLTVSVNVAGIPVNVGPVPVVNAPPGGSDTLVSASVPQAGTSTGALTASSQISGANVTSMAEVIGANVLNNTLAASVINSTCTAGPAGATGGSSLANATVLGAPVNVTSPPNNTIPLPGLGMLIINEQTGSGSSITVNAVRLALTSGLVTGGIVISHSACSADAATVAGAEAGAGVAGPADAVTAAPTFTG